MCGTCVDAARACSKVAACANVGVPEHFCSCVCSVMRHSPAAMLRARGLCWQLPARLSAPRTLMVPPGAAPLSDLVIQVQCSAPIRLGHPSAVQPPYQTWSSKCSAAPLSDLVIQVQCSAPIRLGHPSAVQRPGKRRRSFKSHDLACPLTHVPDLQLSCQALALRMMTLACNSPAKRLPRAGLGAGLDVGATGVGARAGTCRGKSTGPVPEAPVSGTCATCGRLAQVSARWASLALLAACKAIPSLNTGELRQVRAGGGMHAGGKEGGRGGVRACVCVRLRGAQGCY